VHTLHYWAVEADSSEEAFKKVQTRLLGDEEGRFVDWYDWHVVGGGRWSDSQYEDSSSGVVSYSSQPDLFIKVLDDCKKARVNEMNECMANINTDKFISDIVDYISENGILNPEQRFGNLNNYWINNASDLLRDHYTSSSYFYDFQEYTAHIGYIQERLDNSDVAMRQYLIPIDFHF
jgi:hypothetical protein